MARVGLSKSYYAKYNVSSQDGTISYSNGGTLGKAVECEISLDSTDPTIFYADNGPAESAAAFSVRGNEGGPLPADDGRRRSRALGHGSRKRRKIGSKISFCC